MATVMTSVKYFPGTVEISALENQSLIEVRKRRLLMVREQEKKLNLAQNLVYRQVIEDNKAKRKAIRKQEKIKILMDRMNKFDDDYQDGLLNTGLAHQQAILSTNELKARQARIKLDAMRNESSMKSRNIEAIKVAQEIQTQKHEVQEVERNQKLIEVRKQLLTEDRENARATAESRKSQAVLTTRAPINYPAQPVPIHALDQPREYVVQARIIKHGPAGIDQSAIASTVATEAISARNRSWSRVMADLVGVVRGRERHLAALKTLRRTNAANQIEQGLQYLQAEDRTPERMILPRSVRAIQPSISQAPSISAPTSLMDEFERLLIEEHNSNEDERIAPQARPPLQLSRHAPSRRSLSPRQTSPAASQSAKALKQVDSYPRPWRTGMIDASPRKVIGSTQNDIIPAGEEVATPVAYHTSKSSSEDITPLVRGGPHVASVGVQTSQEIVQTSTRIMEADSPQLVSKETVTVDEDEAALQVAYRYFFGRPPSQVSEPVDVVNSIDPHSYDVEGSAANVSTSLISNDSSMQSFVRTIQQQPISLPAREYSRNLPDLVGITCSDVLRESLGLVEQSLDSFIDRTIQRADTVSLRRFDGPSSSSSSSPESVDADVIRSFRLDQEKLRTARDALPSDIKLTVPIDREEVLPSIESLSLTDRLLASVRQPYVRSYLQSLEQHRRATEKNIESFEVSSSDSSVLSFASPNQIPAPVAGSTMADLNDSSSSGSSLFEMPRGSYGGPNTASGTDRVPYLGNTGYANQKIEGDTGFEYEDLTSDWSMLASQDHFVFR